VQLNAVVSDDVIFLRNCWIKFYAFKLKDLDALKLSNRSYGKLKVNRIKSDDHFNYLIELDQLWQKILIYNCQFSSNELLMKLIGGFATSVEELEISDIEILSNVHDAIDMSFPFLKRVMFRNVPSTCIEPFLKKHDQLTIASFDIAQESLNRMPVSEIITQFLTLNTNLQHLQLGPHYIKALFETDQLLQFDFKLDRLLLKFPIVKDSSQLVEDNIVDFIAAQSSIDRILLWELQSDAILTQAWQLPKMKHITLIALLALFDDSMDLILQPNESITQLDLQTRKILLSQLRAFFEAAPNLQILHVQFLTKYVMQFTARNHRNLKIIRYENIDEEEVTEIYDQLKMSTEEDINRNIKLIRASFWTDKANPFSMDPVFWRS